MAVNQKEAWRPQSSSGAKPSHVLTWLLFSIMDQEPAFLIGHDFPVSFFLSAQDGLSELENIFFFFFLTMKMQLVVLTNFLKRNNGTLEKSRTASYRFSQRLLLLKLFLHVTQP